MRIAFEDYNAVLEGLADLHAEGYAYIAFDPVFPVSDVRELHAFDDSYDAVEYCHEMRTDVDLITSQSTHYTGQWKKVLKIAALLLYRMATLTYPRCSKPTIT